MRDGTSNVLLVDDEQAILDLMVDLVTDKSFKATACLSPFAALELVKKDLDFFSAIVTDLKMPGMSGIELIAKVRDLGFDLPIVVVSGHLDQSLTIEALKLGAFDFISKPFDLNHFDKVVVEAVEQGEKLAQSFQEIEANHKTLGPEKIAELKQFRKTMLSLRMQKKRTA